jgi:hypothetical protein
VRAGTLRKVRLVSGGRSAREELTDRSASRAAAPFPKAVVPPNGLSAYSSKVVRALVVGVGLALVALLLHVLPFILVGGLVFIAIRGVATVAF